MSTTLERRVELIAEINYRMTGSEQMLRLRHALEIEKQPTNALESWLLYLKRARIEGKGEEAYEAITEEDYGTE